MTSLLRPIRTVKNAFGNDCVVVRECRHCGTSVDAGTDTCTRCGTQSIARYEIR